MRILFYIEPHPIRGNPLEFKWIAKTMLARANDLNRLSNFSAILFSNPDLKTALQNETGKKTRTHVTFSKSARDQYNQIKSDLLWTDSDIEIWNDVYHDKGDFSEFYRSELERLFIEYDFDLIITWGNSAICRNFCRHYGLFYMAMELGPLRDPIKSTIIADYSGVNGECSTNNIDLNAIRAPFIQEHEREFFNLKQELLMSSHSELSCQAGYILIALQLEDDSNTMFHSKFDSTLELLDFLKDKLKKLDNDLVIKLHPKCRNNEYNTQHTDQILHRLQQLFPNAVIIDGDTSVTTVQLIASAQWVIVNNSSVGFEAAVLGKPVTVLSDNHYGGSINFPSLREIGRWSERKNALFYEKIKKIYSYLFDNNLYVRDYALSNTGFIQVVYQQCIRYQNVNGANLRKTLSACMVANEKLASRQSVKPVQVQIRKHEYKYKIFRKFHTAISLLLLNPRLFKHEVKRRIFRYF